MTLHKGQVHCSWRHAVMRLQSAHLPAETDYETCYGIVLYWSLLPKNNTAINLQTFTSNYGSRRFSFSRPGCLGLVLKNRVKSGCFEVINSSASFNGFNNIKITLWLLKGRIRGGERSLPPKTYKSNFIHHNFVEFRERHSRHKTILPTIVLSQRSVVKHASSLLQYWTRHEIYYHLLLKSPPLTLLAGSAPVLQCLHFTCEQQVKDYAHRMNQNVFNRIHILIYKIIVGVMTGLLKLWVANKLAWQIKYTVV